MPALKRRRWFSLSLRTLLIGMTLISVLFAGFLYHRGAKIAERKRIQARYNAFEFGDSLLGWELPNAPWDGSPDPWKWHRLVAMPEVRKTNLYSDDPNSEEFLALVRHAHSLRLNREDWMGDLPKCLSPRTHELKVRGEFLQRGDLSDLSAAPNLTTFACEPLLSAAGVRAVLSHAKLEDASFQAGVADLATLRDVSPAHLRRLRIKFADEDHAEGDFPWLQTCAELQELHANFDPDGQLVRAVGQHLGGVERLRIELHPDSLDALTGWSRLRHLTLSEFQISPDTLARIHGLCPQLQSLEFPCQGRRSGSFSVADFALLAKFPDLTRLALDRCQLTGEHVAIVGGLTSLEELSLEDNNLSDDDIAPLKALPQLNTINLQFTLVSPGEFANIRGDWRTEHIRRPGGGLSELGY